MPDDTFVVEIAEPSRIVEIAPQGAVLEIGAGPTIEVVAEGVVFEIIGAGVQGPSTVVELDAQALLVLEDRSQIIELPAQQGLPGPRGPAGSGALPSIAFAYGDATPKPLVELTGALASVELDIAVPFDGVGARLSIGTLAQPERFLARTDNDPTLVATYCAAPAREALSALVVYLFITPGSSASAGAGTITLTVR